MRHHFSCLFDCLHPWILTVTQDARKIIPWTRKNVHRCYYVTVYKTEKDSMFLSAFRMLHPCIVHLLISPRCARFEWVIIPFPAIYCAIQRFTFCVLWHDYWRICLQIYHFKLVFLFIEKKISIIIANFYQKSSHLLRL